MASLLFTIGDAVFNALAFSGTNFAFSRLTDHGKEEQKRHDLADEQIQRARDKLMKIERNGLNSLTKDYVKKMRQRHTSTMLTTQWWSTIEYLEKN